METIYTGRCLRCNRAISALIVKVETYEVTTQGKGIAAGQTFTRTRHRAFTASGKELLAYPYGAVEVPCPCGSAAICDPVRGTVTEHPCGPKCHAATGHDCECQCGGKNHGRAHLNPSKESEP